MDAAGVPFEKRERSTLFRTAEVLLWIYGEPPSLAVVNERANRVQDPDLDPSRRYYDPDQERARRDSEQADKIALEDAVRRGELAEEDVMFKMFADVISAARAKIVGLGARLAPRLASESKAAACQRLVDEATRAICLEMSRAPRANPRQSDEKEEELACGRS